MTQVPDQNHAEDIFGVSDYTPEQRPERNFLPWHKPRKQFVRKKQWCEQVLKLIKESRLENNVLKYLGLPGEDLLDLRYLHRTICAPESIGLKFLGFNRAAGKEGEVETELNISLDEIRKLPFVDENSDIIGDDLCKIVDERSLAWKRSHDMGPYDVINIDLCDGFGKHPIGQFQQNHYNMVRKLMDLQARRKNPWLLLLTTRSGPDHTQQDVFNALKKLYNDNLLGCSDFLHHSKENFSIHDSETLNTISSTGMGNSNIFLVALCKWIAQLAAGQNPPAKLEVKSVIGYNVDGKVDFTDLVSIAIKVEPTFNGAADRTGLATSLTNPVDECKTAVQALNRVAKLVNADQALSNDQTLFDEMLNEMSELLNEARYDTTKFATWSMGIEENG